MVQNADYACLVTDLPTVEEVLDDHASELGHDLRGRLSRLSPPRGRTRASIGGSFS